MEIQNIINSLTLEEKAALLQGWTTWTTMDLTAKNIPPVFLSDGPHGLRKQEGAGDHLGLNASVPATCFPTAATMANSWDPSLGEELGAALAEECAANSVHILLGPGLNMKRSPLCGRNFEYFSEDPYLAGKMAAAYIRGIQSLGGSACPKHFAVNSQELRRMSMDSVVDERTLREIYLTGFEIAVKEGQPKCIMTSYNMVNGTYANENSHLLTDILRGEWGFKGFTVSDWGGDNDHTRGVAAGADLVMPAPGPDCAQGLIESVKSGKLNEDILDARLAELLPVILETREALSHGPGSYDSQAHHRLARKCAGQSIVLLENDGILPLSGSAKIAIIGDFAATPRYQGAGSSVVNCTKLDNLRDTMIEAGMNIFGYAPGYSRKDPKPDPILIENAVSIASCSDIVLLCIGLDEIKESEGLDRSSLELSEGQNALLKAVTTANPNTVLVLSGGSPFLIPEDTARRAVIHGYLGGQAGASAMADALCGNFSPCGKLNETWPLSLADTPAFSCFPSKERTSEYREGMYIGYRYYDTTGTPVRYPFGYGLSYTTFAYSDLQADSSQVRFTVTNTGSCDGSEICQLYVSCPEGTIARPKKELKGFAKVFLKSGESRTVSIDLDDKAFRYFNTRTGSWEIESGTYVISIGANVEDIRLTAEVSVHGTDAPLPAPLPDCYRTGHIESVSDADFTALLGHPIPDGSWSGELTANDAICQLYYAKTGLARLVYRILTGMKEKSEAKGTPDLNILFIYNMPFRAIGKMSGGMVSEKMVEDILLMVNGHFWRGLGRIIRHFFANLRSNSAFMRELKS